MCKNQRESGFSLLEVSISLVVIVLLIGMAMPVIFKSNDATELNRKQRIASSLASQAIQAVTDENIGGLSRESNKGKNLKTVADPVDTYGDYADNFFVSTKTNSIQKLAGLGTGLTVEMWVKPVNNKKNIGIGAFRLDSYDKSTFLLAPDEDDSSADTVAFYVIGKQKGGSYPSTNYDVLRYTVTSGDGIAWVNKWHHVVGVFTNKSIASGKVCHNGDKGGVFQIYIDGKLRITKESEDICPNMAVYEVAGDGINDLRLGATLCSKKPGFTSSCYNPPQTASKVRSPDVFSTAFYDEVRIYNKPLGRNEIMNSYLGRLYTKDGLIGDWDVDYLDANNYTIKDKTANGNNLNAMRATNCISGGGDGLYGCLTFQTSAAPINSLDPLIISDNAEESAGWENYIFGGEGGEVGRNIVEKFGIYWGEPPAGGVTSKWLVDKKTGVDTDDFHRRVVLGGEYYYRYITLNTINDSYIKVTSRVCWGKSDINEGDCSGAKKNYTELNQVISKNSRY